MVYIIALCFLVVRSGVFVSALPNGAPVAACGDMTPNHLPNQAQGPAPFQLEAIVMDNGQVMVHLEATSALSFRGFMIMARDEASNERGQGYFIVASDSQDSTRHLNCQGFPKSCDDPAACQGTANALTHANRDSKDAIHAVWTPPTQMAGHTMSFVATVVVKHDTWFQNIVSNSVTV